MVRIHTNVISINIVYTRYPPHRSCSLERENKDVANTGPMVRAMVLEAWQKPLVAPRADLDGAPFITKICAVAVG